MPSVSEDARYAFRFLSKRPGFTAIAVSVLALGIGANTTMFSVIRAVLGKPLDVRDRERVVFLFENNRKESLPKYTFSPANYFDVKERAQTLQQVEGLAHFQGATVLIPNDRGDADRVTFASVTEGFFSLLGAPFAVGRAFVPDDTKSSGAIVISHGFWKRRYGSDPSIVGKPLTVGSQSLLVVGVVGEGFAFPEGVDLWALQPFSPDLKQVRARHFLSLIARLKPGVTVAQARSELDSIAATLAQQYPDTNRDTGINVFSVEDHLVGHVRPAMLILMGAVALMLLIACANIANLLIGRAASRQREISIRSAIGADRGQLVRQLITESLLLSLISGLAGIGLALVATPLVARMAQGEIPRMNQIAPDWTIFTFAFLVSVVCGLVFGTLPALHASRTDLAHALRGNVLATKGRGALRSALVVVEVSLSVILLAGAGLLIKSFYTVATTDPGFRPEGLITLNVNAMGPRYSEAANLREYQRRVLDNLGRLPGVQSVGAVNVLPMSNSGPTAWVFIETKPWPQGQTPPEVGLRFATGGYFPAMGVPLKQGRLFREQDADSQIPYVIVNETFVKRFLNGGNAIGHRIRLGPNPKAAWNEIIGVVGDVKHAGLASPAPPEAYLNQLQNPGRGLTLAVRTSGDPKALTSGVRAAIQEIDPQIAVSNVRSMLSYVESSLAPRRLYMSLLAVFAGIALVLAALGIYGVLAHNVAQRIPEIGVRLALGASPAQVSMMVLRSGTLLIGAGLAAGLAGALGLTHLLQAMLYQVKPSDPIAIGSAVAVLAVVAVLACLTPALRAARVDPLISLRYE